MTDQTNHGVDNPPFEPSQWFTLTGHTMLALSCALQAMLLLAAQTSLALKGNLPQGLTPIAHNLFRAERDMPVYVGSCVLFLALAGVLAMLAKVRPSGGLSAEGQKARAVSAGLFQLLTGLAGLGLFLAFFLYLGPVIETLGSGIWFLGVMPILTFAIGLLAGPITRNACDAPSLALNRRLGRSLDFLFPLLLVAFLFIPDCNLAAGMMIGVDQMHHWNCFAVGPGMAFADGRALGTDFHTQYGVVWPMIVALLAWTGTLDYGSLLMIAMLWCCVYFCAVYALMRLWTASPLWAGQAALAALFVQFFLGFDSGFKLNFPASSVLRAPLDVFIMIGILLYVRRPRRSLPPFIGVMLGLSFALEFDTGIFLLVAIAGFWTLEVWRAWVTKHSSLRQVAIDAALCAVAALLTTGLFLGIATHGKLFSPQTWSGLFEMAFSFSNGIMLLPMGVGLGTAGTLLLVAMVGTYLFIIGALFLRFIARQFTPESVFLGFLAGYGLLAFIQFIGRSAYPNLFHPSVPFVLLCVYLLHAAYAKMRISTGARDPIIHRGILRGAAGAGMLIFSFGIFCLSNFRDYPGLFQRTIRPPEPVYFCKPLGVSATVDRLPLLHGMEFIAAHMRAWNARGKSIFLIDFADTDYYLASGAPPWSQYPSYLHFLIWNHQVTQTMQDIYARPPGVVLVARQPGVFHDFFRSRFNKGMGEKLVPGPPLWFFDTWFAAPGVAPDNDPAPAFFNALHDPAQVAQLLDQHPLLVHAVTPATPATALQLAMTPAPNLTLVDLLLQRGADPDGPSGLKPISPLHLLLRAGPPDDVRLSALASLLAAGANPNALNDNCETPLDVLQSMALNPQAADAIRRIKAAGGISAPTGEQIQKQVDQAVPGASQPDVPHPPSAFNILSMSSQSYRGRTRFFYSVKIQPHAQPATQPANNPKPAAQNGLNVIIVFTANPQGGFDVFQKPAFRPPDRS